MKLLTKLLLFLYLLIIIKLDLCNCIKKINSSIEPPLKCGGKFFGNQYLITSPNYPDNYDNNLNCIYYLIGTNSTTKCSKKDEFHLEFIDFRIEKSDKCSKDYLRIGDDNLYCGNRFVDIRKFNTKNNELIIIFHSDDNNITEKGFRILVSRIPCPDYRSDVKIDGSNVPKNISKIKNESNLINEEEKKTNISYPFYHPNVKLDNENERELNTQNFYPSINNFGNVNFEDSNPSFGANNIGEEMKNENVKKFLNYSPNRGSFDIDESTYNLFDGSNLNTECCPGKYYSSKNISLSSRNFISLLKSYNNYECRYTLERYSKNICELKINFKFFNFGIEDKFCNYGYLEIDGVRYCGCKTGIKITSKFDNISRKIISVNYIGYPKEKFFGYLLEINQELCSTDNEKFDKINLNKRNIDENNFHSIVYDDKNEKKIENIKKRDVGYVYENLMNFNSCKILKFYYWIKAAKAIYKSDEKCSSISNGEEISSIIPIFPRNLNSLTIGSYSSNKNCEIINIVEGIISSINYPSNYPNDSSQCFRFVKAPGNCQLEIAMLDFDLENSIFCWKDYVSFGGTKRRYCGKSLIGSKTIFDFTRSSYADIYFVTDSYGNGRGFKIGFSQISC